jgi:hypothetical protein
MSSLLVLGDDITDQKNCSSPHSTGTEEGCISLPQDKPQMRSWPSQALQIPYWPYAKSPSLAAEIARVLNPAQKNARIARILPLAKEMLSASLDREE